MIARLAQPLCQRKVQRSFAVAELKNDVICSGFTEVLVRSDNEPGILALKESTVTALKLAGANVKTEESALYDSQSNGLAESAVKDAKDAVRTNLACLVRRFEQEFPGGHPVLSWLVKDAKDAVRTNLACLVRRFGQEFPGGHPVLSWLVKFFVAMVNR